MEVSLSGFLTSRTETTSASTGNLIFSSRNKEKYIENRMIFINFAWSNLAVILFLTVTYSTNGQGVASSANSKRKDVAALSDKVSQLFELSSKRPV